MWFEDLNKKEKIWKDKLKGGLSDKKKPSDFDVKLISEGIVIEMEHTDDIHIATELVMDHLMEDLDYYKKLKTIEKNEDNISLTHETVKNALTGHTEHHVKAHTASGEHVGKAIFHDNGDHLKASNVSVKPSHRSQGIATKMYQHAEKVHRKPTKPNDIQTPAGKAFWDQKDRKFGKSEWFEKSSVLEPESLDPNIQDMPELKTDIKKPFKSKAQAKFLAANPEKVGGRGKLKHWFEETDMKNLPEKVSKSEIITELEFEPIEKGLGQLEFSNLPKMRSRPESDVKTIHSPISGMVSARTAAGKSAQLHGVRPDKQLVNIHQKHIASPDSAGVSMAAKGPTGISGSPTNVVYPDSKPDTVRHEALHGTFANLSQKHGLNQNQMQSVHNHFLNMLHPHDVNALHMVMSSRGYDLNHPSTHEETLAHVHQMMEGGGRTPQQRQEKRTGIANTGNRTPDAMRNVISDDASFQQLAKQRNWKDASKNYDKTRLRDSWNNIRSAASNMDEKTLNDIANSNVQPMYKQHLGIK